MSYLLIENNGEASIEVVTLMGASTKRDETNQIGLFGTGGKYSMSVLMRDGVETAMFFGERRVQFLVEPVVFREKTFNKIVVDFDGQRHQTGFTTEMGLKWGVENAIRELISNAIDEGGCEISEVDQPTAVAGKTRIFIQMTPAVQKFYADRDIHFLSLRKNQPLFVVPHVNVEIWPKMGDKARFYRRGVLCYTDKMEGLYDYNFRDIELAEDRTANKSGIDWIFAHAVDSFPFEVKKNIVQNIERDTYEAHCNDMQYVGLTSEDWPKITGDKVVCSTDVYDYALAGEIPRGNLIRTSTYWAKSLKSAGCRDVTDFLSHSALKGHQELTMNDTQLETLTAAVDFMKKAGFELGLADIRVFKSVKKEDQNVMGYWDDKEKKIGVNFIALLKGVRYTVETLLEEVAHRDSGEQDKTRSFQSFLIMLLANQIELRLNKQRLAEREIAKS